MFFPLYCRKQRLLYIRYVRMYFICLFELRMKGQEINLIWVCLIASISCACDDFILNKYRKNFPRETII